MPRKLESARPEDSERPFETEKALAQVRRILDYVAAGVAGLACIATRHGDLVAHVAYLESADAADVARWAAVVSVSIDVPPTRDVITRAMGGGATAHAVPIGGGYVLALLAPDAVSSAIATHRLQRARPLLERMLRRPGAPRLGAPRRNLA